MAPVQRLIAASRAAGIPIVFSQYEFRPDYSDGGLLVELYPALREVGGMVAGTWDAAFDPRLTVEPSDIVISKNRYSAFYRHRRLNRSSASAASAPSSSAA